MTETVMTPGPSKWGEELMATRNREDYMVVVERDEAGMPTVWCDPEIADLVKALNAGGVPTIASCSGHGHRPGSIALKDGRWLVVAKDDAEHDQIEAIFPTDINGEPIIRQSDTRIEGGGWREFRPEEDLPPTGQVEVRWRDADIASSRTAINDAAAIGWQYVSWWRPAAPPSSPVNKSPAPEHVEGDVLSVGEMAFDGVAKRKLEGLIERGWKISGYSLYQDGDHGLITTGGFVGWFSVAERNDAAARSSLATAEAQLADAVKVMAEAFEFLGGVDGAADIREAMLPFLSTIGEKPDAE